MKRVIFLVLLCSWLVVANAFAIPPIPIPQPLGPSDSPQFAGILIPPGTTYSGTGNIAADDMKGQSHVVTGAYTLSLPTAVVGYKAKFKASTAAVFSLDVITGTDVIILNGTALTAGNMATTDGTIYNTLEVECIVAGKYDITSKIGLAIDGGA